MTTVKVRALYPAAFAMGVEAGAEVELDEASAAGLIAEGFAEPVADPPMAAEKRGPGRPKKDED